MNYFDMLVEEDFDGMDGSPFNNVEEIGNALVADGYVLASDSVDAVIALATHDSQGVRANALQHLDYIIKELQTFRANLRERDNRA